MGEAPKRPQMNRLASVGFTMITMDKSELVSLDKFARAWCTHYWHAFIDLEPVSQKRFDAGSGALDCRVSSPTPRSLYRLAPYNARRSSLLERRAQSTHFSHRV
jgi:hypothetical protein